MSDIRRYRISGNNFHGKNYSYEVVRMSLTGGSFLLVLYTTNSKGRSQEVRRLEAFTLDKDSVGKGEFTETINAPLFLIVREVIFLFGQIAVRCAQDNLGVKSPGPLEKRLKIGD